MAFRNCILYLVGFHGIGKLSIAHEICKQADFRLIDNHAINNLVFPFVRVDGKTKFSEKIWDATRKIRDIALDTMVKIGNRDFNFVFTNALIENNAGDFEVYASLKKAVAARDGCFIPVRVLCAEGEHTRRIASPDRETKMKDTNQARIPEIHQNWEPYKPPHPHTITIDVTDLSAAEAARAILKSANEIYEAWLPGAH